MAKKNKKDMKQFQQALLSNAEFIKQPEPVPMAAPEPVIIQEVSVINDDVMEKFKLLASFEGVSEKELINQALNHYLRLKSLQLEQAITNKK
ncbi:MAG TPA: hypothetical protein DCQ26_15850 [Marinilabiliales bacterium]|jgi:hypothetical protein|nr:MAG: hypothetical protein A2W95_05000 [Bacteroidetes bacterium GWA2_40_14]OFX60460.1 MAG: hypothetical protein A2W84_05080 [Bacteroidetes bacterium GWC2_40_13]OFX75483.1 MAG: hypothetical protein A2W96_08490 [Bacteroidetes bacterium GWD2_40_43]OFX93998.1 MAG: hypothetical protein A2W97_14415 [Bacteroidetes bacterium GWE2_40_63]OFY19785.1 MAG: hypothetical protein A2W88_03285 [Bacteroidetes bacterium GWF2_40_13]OFZ28197.1 MAG: hypothetical protein A2437_04780 [Bacteroidetes bacterium RIFOXYC